MAKDIFTPMPLHGVELRNDRRVKFGNLVPDSKTKKLYRVHPDTVQRVKVEIAKSNFDNLSATLPFREAYMATALNPPIVIGRGAMGV